MPDDPTPHSADMATPGQTPGAPTPPVARDAFELAGDLIRELAVADFARRQLERESPDHARRVDEAVDAARDDVDPPVSAAGAQTQLDSARPGRGNEQALVSLGREVLAIVERLQGGVGLDGDALDLALGAEALTAVDRAEATTDISPPVPGRSALEQAAADIRAANEALDHRTDLAARPGPEPLPTLPPPEPAPDVGPDIGGP